MIEAIAGMSQGFRGAYRAEDAINAAILIYGFEPDSLSYTLRWQSEWLGSNVGAFNSIRVLRAQPEGGNLVDYLFFGGDGYVHAFKTAPYTAP